MCFAINIISIDINDPNVRQEQVMRSAIGKVET